jgi:hypothetical protein
MATPCVVDNMVLAMFVDAGRAELLPQLADGPICLTPTILDPSEQPSLAMRPQSEFARGLHRAEQNRADPLSARRYARRAHFLTQQESWQPIELSRDELRLAHTLTMEETRRRVRKIDPAFKSRRIDPGEAECAAVAISRDWTLWSDDQAIISLIRALKPYCQVERICGLLERAVSERLMICPDAAHLYNDIFKGELNLWTKLSLYCDGAVAACR